MAEADRDELYGRRVGEFVLRDRIGEGGFGAVYRCEQPALGREAVVKVLHHRLRGNQVVRQRFLREAKLASRLDHPYAAHVYAFGAETDGMFWIAMEMVHGTGLDRWLRERGPLALDQLVPLFERIAEVVHTAHEGGIVHRDLKPSNIMVIERAGRLLPKLLDFGIAKMLDDTPAVMVAPVAPEPEADRPPGDITLTLTNTGEPEIATMPDRRPWLDGAAARRGAAGGPAAASAALTHTNATLGSPPYMSPEQWGNPLRVGPRSDLYALGVIAYEALTGRRPFSADTVPELAELHCRAEVPPLGAGFPVALDALFRRALAKRTEDRPATALELAEALRVASGVGGTSSPSIGTASTGAPGIGAGVAALGAGVHAAGSGSGAPIAGAGLAGADPEAAGAGAPITGAAAGSRAARAGSPSTGADRPRSRESGAAPSVRVGGVPSSAERQSREAGILMGGVDESHASIDRPLSMGTPAEPLGVSAPPQHVERPRRPRRTWLALGAAAVLAVVIAMSAWMAIGGARDGDASRGPIAVAPSETTGAPGPSPAGKAAAPSASSELRGSAEPRATGKAAAPSASSESTGSAEPRATGNGAAPSGSDGPMGSAEVPRAAGAPGTVEIEIDSEPPGAEVFRWPSEVKVGTTPWRAPAERTDGMAVFVIKKRGRVDQRVEIDLRTGARLHVSLPRAAPGRGAPPRPAAPSAPSRRKGEPADPFGGDGR